MKINNLAVFQKYLKSHHVQQAELKLPIHLSKYFRNTFPNISIQLGQLQTKISVHKTKVHQPCAIEKPYHFLHWNI